MPCTFLVLPRTRKEQRSWTPAIPLSSQLCFGVSNQLSPSQIYCPGEQLSAMGLQPAHRLGAQFHVLTQKRRHSHQNQPNCSWWDWNPKARPRKDLPLLGTLQHGSGGSPGSNLCVVWVRAEAWHGSDVSISHCIALWCGGGEWLQISRWSCLTLYLWLNMHWTKEEDWLTD